MVSVCVVICFSMCRELFIILWSLFRLCGEVIGGKWKVNMFYVVGTTMFLSFIFVSVSRMCSICFKLLR